jgi:hypothetical protein
VGDDQKNKQQGTGINERSKKTLADKMFVDNMLNLG